MFQGDGNCSYFHTFIVKKLGKRAASCKVPLRLVFGRVCDGSNFLRGKNLMKKSESGRVTLILPAYIEHSLKFCSQLKTNLYRSDAKSCSWLIFPSFPAILAATSLSLFEKKIEKRRKLYFSFQLLKMGRQWYRVSSGIGSQSTFPTFSLSLIVKLMEISHSQPFPLPYN